MRAGVIPITQPAVLRMKRVGISVGAPIQQEVIRRNVMSNGYEYREKRIRGADLIAIWALLAALLLVAGLWSFL
jgi:hypothetical protein